MANRSNPELGRTRQALCAIPARKSVWEPGCGLHQGQAVIRPRNVGRTHDRTRPRRTYQIALASTGSSTHDAWYPCAASARGGERSFVDPRANGDFAPFADIRGPVTETAWSN